MKNEFDKYFLPKKEKKWYHFKTLKTDILILYPLMVIVYYCQIIVEKIKNRDNYSDKRTEKVITKWLTYRGKFDIEDEKKVIYLTRNTWYALTLKNWDKIFYENYCWKYQSKIDKYLEFEYEIEGYTKIVRWDENDTYFMYIIFKEI